MILTMILVYPKAYTESESSTFVSGDQDSVIPLTGSRTLVHGLAEELGLSTTVPYRVWFEGKQVIFYWKLLVIEFADFFY